MQSLYRDFLDSPKVSVALISVLKVGYRGERREKETRSIHVCISEDYKNGDRIDKGLHLVARILVRYNFESMASQSFVTLLLMGILLFGLLLTVTTAPAYHQRQLREEDNTSNEMEQGLLALRAILQDPMCSFARYARFCL